MDAHSSISELMACSTNMPIRRNVQWADLPTELLSNVSSFLPTNSIDILAFRAVCKSWNLSSPLPSPFIMSVMLPITAPYPAHTFDERFFDQNLGLPFISVTTIFLIRHPEQKTNGWLLFIDQLTPGKMIIRQPFSKCPYAIPLNFPTFLNVPGIHVDEIAKLYNFSFQPEINKPPSMWSEYVVKVVLNSDESVAFALFENGMIGYSKLRVFPNWEAGSWEGVSRAEFRPSGDLSDRINDIIIYKGKLMCVDRIGRVYVVEFSRLGLRHIIVPSITNASTKRKRLVESNGMLYLVVRQRSATSETNTLFRVYELDEDLNQWVEVSSLGGRSLVFGVDFSFSGEDQQLGGFFEKNSIVYKEGSFGDYDETIADEYDDAIFKNLSNDDLPIGVWRMEDPFRCHLIGSDPGCSNGLWPPPSWLWSVDMSKRIGDLQTALDNILIDSAAENFKDMSDNLAGSVIWSQAHPLKACLNEAGDILRHLESIKANVVSRHQLCESINMQKWVGSSSRGTKEGQGSVSSIQNASEQSETSDDFLLSEMKLHGMILHLEESTSKLQNSLKSRTQSSVDVVS